MTIAYPLTLPTAPVFSSMDWDGPAQAGLSESPFTSEEQAQLSLGERWTVQVALPPMLRAAAAEWLAVRLALRGRYGSFLLGPVGEAASPRGSGAGAPVAATGGSPDVNYANSVVLHTSGWTAGAQNVLRKMDFFSFNDGIATRLHVALNDVSADSSGRADIDIFPRLRLVVANATALTLTNPKGTFGLASNAAPWSLGEANIYGLQFQAMERIRP